MYCPKCNREYDDKVFGDPCPNCGAYLLSRIDSGIGYIFVLILIVGLFIITLLMEWCHG
jgi:hypothetical protein